MKAAIIDAPHQMHVGDWSMPKLGPDDVLVSVILHDVSARDVQFKDNQITLGKNFDTFCPLGPCIVTIDELTDPGHVRLRSLLNGK